LGQFRRCRPWTAIDDQSHLWWAHRKFNAERALCYSFRVQGVSTPCRRRDEPCRKVHALLLKRNGHSIVLTFRCESVQSNRAGPGVILQSIKRLFLIIVIVGTIVSTSCSWGPRARSRELVPIAESTASARDSEELQDFLRITWVPADIQVTRTGGPNALRVFFTATSFFQPAMPVNRMASYLGLADQPSNDLIALRCVPSDRHSTDPTLATWPNVLSAIQRDLAKENLLCPSSNRNAENEAYCIARSYTDEPNNVVAKDLANVLEVANTLVGGSLPEVSDWLRRTYGIYPAFSGLGLTVKDSYNRPQSTAESLRSSIVPEYLMLNVPLADAGCRCLRVPPFSGRSLASLNMNEIWRRGGNGFCKRSGSLGGTRRPSPR
jgi:hypothetical protein